MTIVIDNILGVAPGPPVAADTRASDSAITAADNGKMLDNTGATGTVTLTADAGLLDGFEFGVINVATQAIVFRPPGTQNIVHSGCGCGLGQGVQLSATVGVTATFKLIGSSWYPIIGNAGTFEIEALEVNDLHTTLGIQIADGWAVTEPSGGGTPTTQWRAELVPVADAGSILGSMTGPGVYTDGVTEGSLSDSFLRIVNLFAGTITMTGASGSTLQIQFTAPANANVIGPFIVNGVQNGTSVLLGEQIDFWVGTNGILYLKEDAGGGSGPFTFEQAVANGPA